MNGRASRGSSEQGRAAGEGVILDRLQGLLERQLALVHQGHVAAAAALFAETDLCVQQIAGGALPAGPGSARQWQCIQQLYRELSLTLTAQHAEVSAALRAIRNNRKMLRTYGASLPSS